MKLSIANYILAFIILLPSIALSAERNMVIQLNSKDPLTQKMALNSAKNLKKLLGKDVVDVELVIYGPGINLLRANGRSADKITNLISNHGVKVSVCNGALKAYAKRNGGRELEIIKGVTKVPTGAIRILQLQEKGYAYLRP